MKGHITVGQVVGVVLVVVVIVVVAVVLRGAVTGPSEPVTGQDEPGAGQDQPVSGPQSGGAKVDCDRLVTAEMVGAEAFAEYGLAEKLANGEFVGGEYLGYLYCSHGQPKIGDGYFYANVDVLYMFDAESGELVLTDVEWENPEPPVAPTATEVAIPTPDPNAVTVCIDGETPLAETGGENPQQFVIWDIIGGKCSVSMGGSETCFACGEGTHLLVPAAGVPEEEMPVWPDNGETLCIDATTAAALQAEAGGEVVEIAAPRDCSFELGGGGGLCWICGGGEAEPVGEPSPSPEPTEEVVQALTCAEYLTEEVVGAEEWARYGIGEKVGSGEIVGGVLADQLLCSYDRTIGEASVVGDGLVYWFEPQSGVLLRKRIHWRHDLPEHLPPIAITREEAEAMVEGEIRHTYLGLLSPDHSSQFQATTFQDPYWFVSAQEDPNDTCPWMTVIDAMTGEVVGHWMQ